MYIYTQYVDMHKSYFFGEKAADLFFFLYYTIVCMLYFLCVVPGPCIPWLLLLLVANQRHVLFRHSNISLINLLCNNLNLKNN